MPLTKAPSATRCLRISTILTAALFPAAALAALPAGVVHQREGSQGEYTPAYEVKKDTVVMATRSPGPQVAKDVSCRLIKGTRLVFGVTGRSVTQTYVFGKAYARKDLTLSAFTPGDISARDLNLKVSKNDVVEDVTYLAEGYCHIRHKGIIYEAGCTNLSEPQDNFNRVAELKTESWSLQTCAGGTKAWVSQGILDANRNLEFFLYSP